jgi:hypothetical protein
MLGLFWYQVAPVKAGEEWRRLPEIALIETPAARAKVALPCRRSWSTRLQRPLSRRAPSPLVVSDHDHRRLPASRDPCRRARGLGESGPDRRVLPLPRQRRSAIDTLLTHLAAHLRLAVDGPHCRLIRATASVHHHRDDLLAEGKRLPVTTCLRDDDSVAAPSCRSYVELLPELESNDQRRSRLGRRCRRVVPS